MNGPVTPRLYVLSASADTTIPLQEAQAPFQIHWRDARHAYIELIAQVGGYWAKDLLVSAGKPLKVAQVRATRAEAQKVAEAALSVVAALDAAVRVCERTVPDKVRP